MEALRHLNTCCQAIKLIRGEEGCQLFKPCRWGRGERNHVPYRSRLPSLAEAAGLAKGHASRAPTSTTTSRSGRGQPSSLRCSARGSLSCRGHALKRVPSSLARCRSLQLRHGLKRGDGRRPHARPLITSLTTLRQVDLNTIIAYSPVAHMHFVTLGLFSLNAQGIEENVLKTQWLH